MIEFPLEIPERSGEVLLAPRDRDLFELARANRASLDAAAVRIAGAPLGEWRARARAEVLSLARRHTEKLGIGPVVAAEGDLLLATGHQPVFPHPGIWVKYLLLDRLAAGAHSGLAVSVDSDAMEEVAADIPTQPAGTLQRRREILRRAGAEEPYEAHAAPTAQEWQEFLARVDRDLQSFQEPQVYAPWQRFSWMARPNVQWFAEFMTVLRRRHEGPRRFFDLAISTIAETQAFRAFFLRLAGESARFAEAHNRHLQAYRAGQHIRTEAQPFADLEVSSDRVELPFWTVNGGRRQRLFLLLPAQALATPERALGPLPRDPAAPVFAQLGLRPRALTLTAFLRLFLSDLFIHGVGGARYDRVTDAVMAEFLEISPSAYVVASATLHLPFAAPRDPAAGRAALAQQIQEARHNPERLLRDPTAEQVVLVDEKWRLIRRLETAPLTRPERREVTRRIRDINERLSAALASSLAAMETELAALGEGDGSADAATYRGYPFFLFEPEVMEPLVSAMLGGGAL